MYLTIGSMTIKIYEIDEENKTISFGHMTKNMRQNGMVASTKLNALEMKFKSLPRGVYATNFYEHEGRVKWGMKKIS